MNIDTFKLAGISPEVGKSYDFGGQKARIVSITGTGVIANFAPIHIYLNLNNEN